MIDQKGARLYAAQLHSILMANDPSKVLGNPIARALLLSLARDLASMVEGSAGDELRRGFDDVRIMSDDGGEFFIIG